MDNDNWDTLDELFIKEVYENHDNSLRIYLEDLMGKEWTDRVLGAEDDRS